MPMDESHILALDMQRRFLSQPPAEPTARAFECAWQEAAELGLLLALAPDELGGLGANGDFRFGYFHQRGEHLASMEFGPSLAGAWSVLAGTGRESLTEALGLGTHRVAMPTFPDAIGTFPVGRKVVLKAKDDKFLADCAFEVLRGAPVATHFLLPARLDGSDEPALLLLPAELPGLSIEPFTLVDGSAAGSLRIAGATINPEHILVKGEQAEALWIEGMDAVAAATAAEAVGIARAMLGQTIAFIRQRTQFGQTIGSFQAIQHRAAEMLVEVEQVHALALAACRNPSDPFLVSGAKVRANMALQHVADSAVQFHGGIGTTEELALARYFRRAMALRGELGTTEQHYARIDALARKRLFDGDGAETGDGK